MILAIFFISLFIMLIIGFPIYICLIGASFIYIALNPDVSFVIGIQRMITAPNSFTLLAVPFFIFAGQIMNSGGITKRIYRFALSLVGHFQGGLGYVNIIASMIFAGMSGSALADAGGLGLVEIQAMREHHYDDDFTLGVTASSSIIGPIIPPSIPFVIYGAVANVSVGGLFIGGIIPGFIMAASLFIMCFIIAKKRNYNKIRRASLREIITSLKEAFLAILTPFIIIGGIWFGIFTPTEAAAVSIVYALIVTIFVYKEQHISDLPRLIFETVRMVAPAIMIVAAANLFGWIMNYEQIDQFLMEILFGITKNPILILIIINIILLILGMFLEVVSAIMLMLPIISPIVLAIGIHPVHLGVIMVLNLMIGLLTPPVGFVLYVLSSAAKVPVNNVIRYVTPWIIPLIISLLLITFIPELVLFLPRVLGFIR